MTDTTTIERKPPTQARTPEQYLTAKEVAAQLRVSLTWVSDHSNKKHRPYLPSIKMGRAVRYRQSDIDAFMAHCQRRMAANLPLY